jgi:hypothetical protein
VSERERKGRGRAVRETGQNRAGWQYFFGLARTNQETIMRFMRIMRIGGGGGENGWKLEKQLTPSRLGLTPIYMPLLLF